MPRVRQSFDLAFLSVSLWPQGYDNTESSVRKASVFCLVAIYSVIGEELKPHLAQLTGSKVCIVLHGWVVHLGLPVWPRPAALQSGLQTDFLSVCELAGPYSPGACL